MPAPKSRSHPQHGVIRVRPEADDIDVVCLEGDFDLTNARALEARIDGALDGGKDLILDFTDATFVDSSVIRVVARAARSAEMRERTIVLQLGTPAIVKRVFEVVKIEQVLPRAHDRQEALRMIQQQAVSG